MPVIEEVLGVGVVDCHHWEAQRALGLHCPQPNHSSGGLLHRAHRGHVGPLGMEQRHQIGPVVHGDVRFGIENRVEMPVITVGIFFAYRKDRDPIGYQRGRHVVLGRQRVRGAQRHLSSSGPQSAHQVGGFRRDMHTSPEPDTGERLALLIAAAKRSEYRHTPRRPSNALLSSFRKGRVGNVVIHVPP